MVGILIAKHQLLKSEVALFSGTICYTLYMRSVLQMEINIFIVHTQVQINTMT